MEQFADLDPAGVIEGDPDSPIRLDDWLAWIVRDQRLHPPDPVLSINPFNRKPFIIDPHPGTAYVLDGKARVGLMSWSEAGADEIVVYGPSPAVIALAREVAKHLGGRFRLLDAE